MKDCQLTDLLQSVMSLRALKSPNLSKKYLSGRIPECISILSPEETQWREEWKRAESRREARRNEV